MLKKHKDYVEIFSLLADVAVLDCFSLKVPYLRRWRTIHCGWNINIASCSKSAIVTKYKISTKYNKYTVIFGCWEGGPLHRGRSHGVSGGEGRGRRQQTNYGVWGGGTILGILPYFLSTKGRNVHNPILTTTTPLLFLSPFSYILYLPRYFVRSFSLIFTVVLYAVPGLSPAI